MSEIAKKLRALIPYWPTHAELLEEAADALAFGDPKWVTANRQLKTDNDRLRAALAPFAGVPPGGYGSKERLLVVSAGKGPYHFLERDLQNAKRTAAIVLKKK